MTPEYGATVDFFPVDQIHAGNRHYEDTQPSSHIHINSGLFGDEPHNDHAAEDNGKLQFRTGELT